MTQFRRAAVYKLAASAQEMELDVMNGRLEQTEDGRWTIGGHDLTAWLAGHTGQELVVVLSSADDDRPLQVRTCRTCGRDYTDLECPYCRANRIRLRGHA